MQSLAQAMAELLALKSEGQTAGKSGLTSAAETAAGSDLKWGSKMAPTTVAASEEASAAALG